MRKLPGVSLFCKGIVPYPQCIFVLTLFMLAHLAVLSLPGLAETKQIRSVINPSREQTFSQMMQQAESQATQLIDQAFAENSTVTDISIVILGERNGQEIPLLTSTLSRTNWQKTPRIQAWAKYFGNATVALLGFTKLPTPQTTSPAAPPSAAPTPDGYSSQLPDSSLQPQQTETSSNPSTPPSGSPSIKPSPPINPGFTPARIRIQDDPGYRDD
ncbi:MAG: hypothetical protein WCA35_29410 [Kovacikia sp.]